MSTTETQTYQPRLKLRYRDEIRPQLQRDLGLDNVMLVQSGDTVRVGYERQDVEKRRPDGSTYAAQRSVRVERKSRKEI